MRGLFLAQRLGDGVELAYVTHACKNQVSPEAVSSVNTVASTLQAAAQNNSHAHNLVLVINNET